MVFEIKSGIKNLNITLNQFVPHYLVITLLCLDSISIYDDDIGLEEGCVLASQLSRLPCQQAGDDLGRWGNGKRGKD